jgi:hypothetical protein
MGGADGGASDGKKKGCENGCASDEKGARRGRRRRVGRFSACRFFGHRVGRAPGSHLVARVGVELGEVRQRDDRGDGDDGHEHGGEHETRSVVRPPSVLREETRVRCGVFSFAAGLIILSRPRLPRARSPRLAGGGGHVERSGISTCARAPASPSVDKPCRAGGNADNAVVAARVLHPTDAREGIKGLFCFRRSFDNTRTSGHLRRSRFRFPR